MRTGLALIAAALICPVVAFAQEAKREITGSVAYRERIALPDDARVVIELRDAGGAVVYEDSFPTGGKQVPIEFILGAPSDVPLSLRTAIFVGGQPAWLSDPVEIAAGSEAVTLDPIQLGAFKPMGFASTWSCGPTEVSLGYIGDIARMRIGTEYFDLSPEVTASGAKFTDASDAGTWAWSKGNDLTVSLRGQTLADCRPGVPGASFTARGNEPGWRLDIEGSEATLLMRNGEETLTATLPEPEPRPDGRRYTLVDSGIVITIRDALCRDDMSGMPHPAQVTLEQEGTTLKGCGGDPMDLLTGGEWQVEDLRGGGVIDNSHVTLLFTPDGRVAGSGGCNRWFSGFTLTGEGLSFDQAGSTMMACAPSLMEQERTFLDALASVDAFDISETGALVLSAGGTPVITARR